MKEENLRKIEKRDKMVKKENNLFALELIELNVVLEKFSFV